MDHFLGHSLAIYKNRTEQRRMVRSEHTINSLVYSCFPSLLESLPSPLYMCFDIYSP